MLRLKGVSKSYGAHRALDDVDLQVRPGEIVGLLGPNGAGKTTLASIAAGLIRPDRGHVEVSGIDVLRSPRAARRRLGLAPQEIGVYLLVTVEENLRYFGELAGLRDPTLRRRIEEMGEALDLLELFPRLAFALSGGEKRRLHVAMAMLHHPPLLILDEPTVGADVRLRAALLELVRDRAAAGAAVLYTTHYLPEVEALGAGVCILDRGRVLASGPLRSVVEGHADTVVELGFDGPAPRLDVPGAEVHGSVIRIRTAEPAVAAAAALKALGRDAERLEGIEILRPSLEGAYLAITGRRYPESDESGGSGPA